MSNHKSNYFEESPTALLDDIAKGMALDMEPAGSAIKVIITIPAHNEEDCILDCIEALNNQCALFKQKINYEFFEIIVGCHNCTDETYAICNAFKIANPLINLQVLEIQNLEINNVGAVRRVLMHIAYDRISTPDGYIATTDADSIADHYWLANLMAYVGSPYGLICGRLMINMDGITGNARLTLKYKRKYEHLVSELRERLMPDDCDVKPRHSDNSGPNLAVRADVYKSVGGIRPLGFCEDIAFYDSIIYNGYKVRHCPDTIVLTSCRQDPRAPWGFGAELGTWNAEGLITYEVEGLNALLARFKIYALAQSFFLNKTNEGLRQMSEMSGLSQKEFLTYFSTYPTVAAVHLKLEKELDKLHTWRDRYPKQNIGRVLKELENFLRV